METADFIKMKDLKDENRRLKKILMNLILQYRALKAVIDKIFKSSDKA